MQRNPPDLKELFLAFCEHLDGKLVWKRRGGLNMQLLSFFEKKAEELHYPHQRDIMETDLVWWSELNEIELALQHEAHVRDVPKFFIKRSSSSRDQLRMYPQEVRQLIYIKALRKILIVYVSEAGEQSLITAFETWLKTLTHRIPNEQYMIIIGRSVRKEVGKKPGILFHAYIFLNTGFKMAGPLSCHLTQAQEEKGNLKE
jgi:hypothetical protein